MTQIEMIPYIKESIKKFENKDETSYYQVMMEFNSIYHQYIMLVTEGERFESEKDYEFFMEFLNRSHDVFYEAVNLIGKQDSNYSCNNFLPIRIILASMLFGIERREKKLI